MELSVQCLISFIIIVSFTGFPLGFRECEVVFFQEGIMLPANYLLLDCLSSFTLRMSFNSMNIFSTINAVSPFKSLVFSSSLDLCLWLMSFLGVCVYDDVCITVPNILANSWLN